MPKVLYTTTKGLHQKAGSNEVDLGPSATVKVRANGSPALQTLCWMYDFSALGGAASEINLTDPKGNGQSIPRGFVCIDGWVETVTAMTSGGSATVMLGTQGTSNDPNGLKTDVAFDHASFALSFVTPLNGALVAASDGSGVPVHKKVITTADPLSVTISTAALTAGKFYVFLRGYHSLSVA